MLRITTEPQGLTGRLLHVEGRLVGAWVSQLHDECERALAGGFELTLELSGVRFADPEGRRLLRALIYRSVTLIGRTPFIDAQLGVKES